MKSIITTSITTLITGVLTTYRVNLSPYHISLIHSGVSEIVTWSEKQLTKLIEDKTTELTDKYKIKNKIIDLDTKK
jgi:hypothetical protein